MRRSALTGLGAAAALIAACASSAVDTGELAPVVQSAAEAGAPAPMPGLDWTYMVDDDEAKLAYGAPNTDDLRLGLECVRGSGQVTITRNALAGEPARFQLESGGETETVAAVAEETPVEGQFLMAELDVKHPVFQRFRQTGWIAQWLGDRRQMMTPQPASRPKIEAFFAHCG